MPGAVRGGVQGKAVQRDALQAARRCAQVAWNKKGHDIVIIDVENLISVSDYFVICTAESSSHINAIADAVVDDMKENKAGYVRIEGYKKSNWVLIDNGEVVVHVFDQQARQFYNIENLWADGKREKFVKRAIAKLADGQ